MSDDDSSSTSSCGPPVPAAVLSRSRRATAGSRMTSLVGKAKDKDDSFWGHSTWTEGAGSSDEESGASSFRESDEDEEDRVDKFDSDFDDSESEADDEAEDARVADREREMEREEKRSKSRKGQKGVGYDDIVSAGRELMQKKKGAAKRKKALMGDGINAGLVLNFPGMQAAAAASEAARGAVGSRKGAFFPVAARAAPPAAKALAPAAASTAVAAAALPKAAPAPAAAAAAPPAAPPTPTRASSRRTAVAPSATETATAAAPPPAATSRRSLRGTTVTKSIETAHSVRQAERETAKRQAEIQKRRAKDPTRRRYTQEELLIEAANDTEPDNARWILNRRRVNAEADAVSEDLYGRKIKGGAGNTGEQGKVVMKFHSRRGCYNTLTFPDMEYVPEVLARKRQRAVRGGTQAPGPRDAGDVNGEVERDDRICVITGKKACYRDPKTLRGYHDLAAFKELRRRMDAGEPLDRRTAKKEENGKGGVVEPTRQEVTVPAPVVKTEGVVATGGLVPSPLTKSVSALPQHAAPAAAAAPVTAAATIANRRKAPAPDAPISGAAPVALPTLVSAASSQPAAVPAPMTAAEVISRKRKLMCEAPSPSESKEVPSSSASSCFATQDKALIAAVPVRGAPGNGGINGGGVDGTFITAAAVIAATKIVAVRAVVREPPATLPPLSSSSLASVVRQPSAAAAPSSASVVRPLPSAPVASEGIGPSTRPLPSPAAKAPPEAAAVPVRAAGRADAKGVAAATTTTTTGDAVTEEVRTPPAKRAIATPTPRPPRVPSPGAVVAKALVARALTEYAKIRALEEHGGGNDDEGVGPDESDS